MGRGALWVVAGLIALLASGSCRGDGGDGHGDSDVGDADTGGDADVDVEDDGEWAPGDRCDYATQANETRCRGTTTLLGCGADGFVFGTVCALACLDGTCGIDPARQRAVCLCEE